jgi:alanyl-tRNA synthetase
MYELVPLVESNMRDFYTELSQNVPFVQKVIKNEEERFHETIHEGLTILKDIIKEAKSSDSTVIQGEDAFKLYDTFGFPVELTEEYAMNEGLTVDQEGFENALEAQRSRARAARQSTDSMQVQNETFSRIDADSHFVGYTNQAVEAKITAIVSGNQLVDIASEGDQVQLFLDQTPFYAESGGQVSDQGILRNEKAMINVKDVKKAPKGQNMHIAVVESGQIKTGDVFTAEVFGERRSSTEKNHTATHLLHQALKDTLGAHVNQAGSLVSPERLRFDFTHFGQVSEDELKTIEKSVNEKIWENLAVKIMEKPIAEAKEMGAMALFGEKYGDIVRVVQIGSYSLELCGGCHVKQTSEIGLFKIASESGIGAGTRRIEALTGKAAFERLNHFMNQLEEMASQLKTTAGLLPEKIDALQLQVKTLEKENEALQTKLGQAEANDIKQSAESVNNITVLAQKVDAGDMNQLRTMLDQLKPSFSSAVIVLASVHQGKVNLAAMVTKDLNDRGLHAGKLIKEVATRCGGGGGGRPDMAQAGGKNPAQVPEALKYVKEYVVENS